MRGKGRIHIKGEEEIIKNQISPPNYPFTDRKENAKGVVSSLKRKSSLSQRCRRQSLPAGPRRPTTYLCVPTATGEQKDRGGGGIMVTHPKYPAPGDKARTRSQPSRGPSSTPLGDPWARPAARAHYPSMVRMSFLPVSSAIKSHKMSFFQAKFFLVINKALAGDKALNSLNLK